MPEFMLTIIVELIVMKNMNRTLLLFSLFVVFYFILLPVRHSLSVPPIQRAVEWQDAQQIVQMEPGMFHYVWYLRPKVAAANGQAFVVWQDFNLSSLDKRVWFSSFDGTEWHLPILLNEEVCCHEYPDIAVENEHIHVVWASGKQPVGDYKDFMYRHYDGTTWFPVINISFKDEDDPFFYGGPHIAVEQDQLHLVWWARKSISDPTILFYQHFNGTVWQPRVQIGLTNQSSEGIGRPALTVVEGTIHVVWAQEKPTYGIYYQQFDGLSWQSPELISSFGLNPSVSAGKDSVHVVWEVARGAQREFDIYYRRFYGGVWESPLGLSSKGPETLEENHLPAIVERQGRLYVVWFDFFLTAEGKYNVYGGAIMFCHHDGTTWYPEEKLQEAIRQEAGYPTLAGDSTSLHLVWVNRDVSGEVSGIFYRKGIIQGGTTGKDVPSVEEDFSLGTGKIIAIVSLVPTTLYEFKRRTKRED